MGLGVVHPQNGSSWKAREGPFVPTVGAQGLFRTFSVLNHQAICALNYAVLFIAASKSHTSACKLYCWGSKQSARHLDALKRALARPHQIPECRRSLPSISCMTKGESPTLSQPWFPPWWNASTIPPHGDAVQSEITLGP